MSTLDLRSLFSPPVRVAFAALGDYDLERGWARLFEVERAHVARAVEKRRREFTCGRELARRVLGELAGGGPGRASSPGPELAPEAPDSPASYDTPAIGVGPKREPLWPAGFVGSIAHTDGACVAVAARAADVRSLGVDVEPALAFPSELCERVLTPAEQAAFALRGEPRAGLLARAAFSAKESVYKAQFPLTGAWVDFHDVEIDFDDVGTEFVARFSKAPSGLAPGTAWRGRWSLGTRWLLTAVELPGAGS